MEIIFRDSWIELEIQLLETMDKEQKKNTADGDIHSL